MIDKSKLNRVKGILRAHGGAEVPKIQISGGALAKYNPGDQDFINFSNSLGIPGSTELWSDFVQLKLFNPTATVDQLVKDYNDGKHKNTTLGTTTQAATSPNDPPKVDKDPAAVVSEKIAGITETSNGTSAGMNFKDKVKGVVKDLGESLAPVINQAAPAITDAVKGLGDAFGAAQSATDSNTTKTADAIYDQASEMIKKTGPVGQIVGTAMGFAGQAGDIIQGLGGGTDQMTSTDKWMDSSFFSWNIGMLNGFGGKRSDAFAGYLYSP